MYVYITFVQAIDNTILQILMIYIYIILWWYRSAMSVADIIAMWLVHIVFI